MSRPRSPTKSSVSPDVVEKLREEIRDEVRRKFAEDPQSLEETQRAVAALRQALVVQGTEALLLADNPADELIGLLNSMVGLEKDSEAYAALKARRDELMNALANGLARGMPPPNGSK